MSNESAFATIAGEQKLLNHKDGLTKRELFAAMAMQGQLACPLSEAALDALDVIEREHGNNEILRITAQSAVKYADALLAELAKEPPWQK